MLQGIGEVLNVVISRRANGLPNRDKPVAAAAVHLDRSKALRLEIAALRRLHGIGAQLYVLTGSQREKALADDALSRADRLTHELDVVLCATGA